MSCAVQSSLFDLAPAPVGWSGPWPALSPTPDLASYDWIVLSSSGGKDSLLIHALVADLAAKAGIADRIVVVHADLGDAEWPGTLELVRSHTEAFGHRLEVVRRTFDGRHETLLDYLLRKRGKWPSSAARWCTSDLKRGPIRTLFTRLAAETRAKGVTGRPARILSVMGMRAAESPARARLETFRHLVGKTCPCPQCRAVPEDQRKKGGVSNGCKHVDEWLPVHSWPTAAVYAFCESTGLPMHPSYAAGLPRASCVFCVLAGKGALVRSAQLFPDLAARYAAAEAQIGHTFQAGRSMADIIAAAQAAGDAAVRAEEWVG